MYYDRYDEARLQSLAQALLANPTQRREAWCIFDNTAGGHAIANAARLQELLVALANPVAKADRDGGAIAGRRITAE